MRGFIDPNRHEIKPAIKSNMNNNTYSLKLSDSGHTLEANSGDIVLLNGDTGCGKSLWLKRMAGTLALPKGISLSMPSTAPVVRMQSDRWPYIWLGGTVEEELVFGLKQPVGNEQLKSALLAWGLSNVLLSTEPQHLNRLQCIRLSLAAMDLAEPSLVLLDNPSAALSQPLALDLANDIAAWVKQSKAIVVVASNRWHDWHTVVTQTWSVSTPDSLPVRSPTSRIEAL